MTEIGRSIKRFIYQTPCPTPQILAENFKTMKKLEDLRKV
jgi:hypothetical protein